MVVVGGGLRTHEAIRVPHGSFAAIARPMELIESSSATSLATHHTTLAKEDHRAWASRAIEAGSGSPARVSAASAQMQP